ncbi:MAG: hypothetical protein PHF73_12720 [Massilibacteroides sp.]|nr:hypothetical protein [Massilibacteroides sp.]
MFVNSSGIDYSKEAISFARQLFFYNEKRFNLYTIILGLFVLAYIVITYLFPYISPDSGFYLKIANDISNGASFFIDMNVAYTPMGMYLYSWLFMLFPHPQFWILNTFVIVFYVINNILLYRILTSFKLNRQLRIFLVVVNFLGFYILQGTHILLEQFVLLFQLLSIMCLLKWDTSKWYWLPFSGFACFFAFFSKQYGLFILPAIGFWLFIRSQSIGSFAKFASLWFLGFLLPTLFVFSIFSVETAVQVKELIQKLLGINVLSGDEVITGVNYTFNRFVESVLNFPIKSPVVIMLIVITANKKFRLLDHRAIFLILLILGGFAQLLFANYAHYFQLILPYCILAVGYFYQRQPDFHKKQLLKILNILVVLTILSSGWWLQKDFRILKYKTLEQTTNKEILNNILPEGSKVYLEGILPSYYYICMFHSPEPQKLGYRFPEELTLERISRSMPTGTYIITKLGTEKHPAFVNKFKLIQQLELLKGECLILQKIVN